MDLEYDGNGDLVLVNLAGDEWLDGESPVVVESEERGEKTKAARV